MIINFSLNEQEFGNRNEIRIQLSHRYPMTLEAYSIYGYNLISFFSIFLGNSWLAVLSFCSVSIQFLVSGQDIFYLSYYTVEPRYATTVFRIL